MVKRVSLFKVLRRELGSGLASQGFKEIPQGLSKRNSMLFYFRDSSFGTSLGFWFQRNVKASFVDAIGSSFTLEFFRSLADPYEMDTRRRAFFLLTPPELEEMRSLQNKMIGRLPPLEAVLKPYEMKLFSAGIEAKRQIISKPFNPLHDLWMRYRDEVDLLAWTSLIGTLLPSLTERFHRAKPSVP